MTDIDLTAEVKSDKLKGYWIKVRLVYLAILIFSLIYAIVVFALKRSGILTSMDFLQEKEIAELAAAVRNILIGISLLTICAAAMVGFLLAKRVGKGSSLSLSIDSSIAPNLASYFIYIVVVAAILDSIGIYGLTIYFLTQELHWFIIIIALSFMFKLFYLPSQNRFIALMEKYRHIA